MQIGTNHPSERDVAEELIERLVARDQRALDCLYKRYVGVMYSLALRITRDRAEADEVVVESLWQIWQQASRYDPTRGHLSAWILTITRSRALDRLRLKRRHSSVVEPLVDSVLFEASCIDPGHNPEQDFWQAERNRRVHAAFAELAPAQRKVIELAYYDGLSHTEIAEAVGEPLGTVKTRIRLGMMNLREKLGMERSQSEEKSKTATHSRIRLGQWTPVLGSTPP